MKVPIKRIAEYDGKTCFICGKYLLNHTDKDLAYQPVHTGSSIKMKPERYFLFSCPNCGKDAHKRCWYNHAEKKTSGGWFRKKKWKLSCPNCQTVLSSEREKTEWKHGYQIPNYPDDQLIELHVTDVFAWKAGSVLGKVRKAINDFFIAVGLGSLTDTERSAVARAAAKIGKTLQDIAQKVFKLDVPVEKRTEIKELKCQNCAAPLPLPEPYEEAVVCAHCGTAHLLPT